MFTEYNKLSSEILGLDTQIQAKENEATEWESKIVEKNFANDVLDLWYTLGTAFGSSGSATTNSTHWFGDIYKNNEYYQSVADTARGEAEELRREKAGKEAQRKAYEQY
jgi:hypothetical protein